MKQLTAALSLIALSACAEQQPLTITAGQGGPVAQVASRSDVIVTGLQDASFNLHEAVRIGVLDANDPAPKCVDDVLADMGVGQDRPSFEPRVSDLISAGSVAYIEVQRAKKAQAASGNVSTSCDAIIGMVVRDAARAGIRGASGLLPGSGVLRALGR